MEPAKPYGPGRKRRQDDEALAPMAVFPARRVANNACAIRVALLDSQAGKSAHDGLKLVVVWRAVGCEGNHGAQRAVGFCQVADFGAALGRQRLQAQGFPGRKRVTLDECALAWRARLVAGFETPPPAPAQSVVNIQTKLSERAVGYGLDHAGQPGFGRGIELALADARVNLAVGARLPCLWSIKHHYADSAHAAQVVQATAEDIRVYPASVGLGGRVRKGWWEDFAGDWRLGCFRRQRRAGAIKHHDAQIGPAAECEINGKDSHGSTVGSVGWLEQWGRD